MFTGRLSFLKIPGLYSLSILTELSSSFVNSDDPAARLSDFHALAKTAASNAVAAVREASKKIRDALFHAILTLHPSEDQISEATKDIVGKFMSKRSADGE